MSQQNSFVPGIATTASVAGAYGGIGTGVQTGSDFRALMQANVNSAGLSRSLLSIEPLDADQVRVTFGAVPFAAWLAWVESLRSQQIRLDTTRIEALATPGLASATATFTRSRQ